MKVCILFESVDCIISISNSFLLVATLLKKEIQFIYIINLHPLSVQLRSHELLTESTERWQLKAIKAASDSVSRWFHSVSLLV